MPNDIVIVYTPCGGGHRAAAQALAEQARACGHSVVLVDMFEHCPRIVADAYLSAHFAGQSAAPLVYGSAYEASNHRGGLLEPLRLGFDQVAFGELLNVVQREDPQVVVATHHLPLVVLGHARRQGTLSAGLLGVVTDFTAHACWAEHGVDAFAVACNEAKDELAHHGVRSGAIEVTGIPVRPAFAEASPWSPPAPGEPLKVLVTAGGFGVGPVRRVVRSLRGHQGIEATIVCGSSQPLFRAITDDVRRYQLNARVVGFERDMPRRMAEAHVVVGKAGGLTLAETLTAGRPLIIAGAVFGNETRNERFVVERGAGLRSHPDRVGEAILHAWSHGLLGGMARRGQKLVPANAGARVLDLAIRVGQATGVHRAA
jgi:processive 1,2-diacylglycerol beta-glucosyltransferase